MSDATKALSTTSKINVVADLIVVMLVSFAATAWRMHALEPRASLGALSIGLAVWLFASLAPELRNLGGAYGPPQDVLMLGIGALGRLTGLEIVQQKHRKRRVFGYLTFGNEAAHTRLPASIVGTADDLERILREHAFDEVYIAGNMRQQGDEMQAAIHICERFGVPFALPVSHFRLDRARPATKPKDGYVHYLSFEHKPLQMVLKRAFDMAASAAALAVLTPLFLVVAALIKVTSRGPVLFAQERVGQYGAPFHMLKFRSMVVNAEELKDKLMALNEQSGPVFKMKNDPRVTWIGRIIRKYSIDELPQLINVLRGEMSVVGPRPPVPKEVGKYESWQWRRLSVRPGLTCVWQVSGRNHISFEQWMYLDMQYIDHWSLKGDFELILKTLPVVLLGRGAS